MDKLGMTGSNLQLVNGVALLSTFFGARLGYGGLMVSPARLRRLRFLISIFNQSIKNRVLISFVQRRRFGVAFPLPCMRCLLEGTSYSKGLITSGV